MEEYIKDLKRLLEALKINDTENLYMCNILDRFLGGTTEPGLPILSAKYPQFMDWIDTQGKKFNNYYKHEDAWCTMVLREKYNMLNPEEIIDKIKLECLEEIFEHVSKKTKIEKLTEYINQLETS